MSKTVPGEPKPETQVAKVALERACHHLSTPGFGATLTVGVMRAAHPRMPMPKLAASTGRPAPPALTAWVAPVFTENMIDVKLVPRQKDAKK